MKGLSKNDVLLDGPEQMSRETDLVVTVLVGELVDLGAELVEVTVEREVGLHDVLALEVIFI